MAHWSGDLARGYAACRGAHPEDRVLVVCDLDGTLLAHPGTGAPRPSPGVVAVTDLQQFLAAVLQLPSSLTADLTLPEWHYFGSGSGNDGDFHRSPRAAATSPGLDTP